MTVVYPQDLFLICLVFTGSIFIYKHLLCFGCTSAFLTNFKNNFILADCKSSISTCFKAIVYDSQSPPSPSFPDTQRDNLNVLDVSQIWSQLQLNFKPNSHFMWGLLPLISWIIRWKKNIIILLIGFVCVKEPDWNTLRGKIQLTNHFRFVCVVWIYCRLLSIFIISEISIDFCLHCNGFYIQFRQSFAKETLSYDEMLKS